MSYLLFRKGVRNNHMYLFITANRKKKGKTETWGEAVGFL